MTTIIIAWSLIGFLGCGAFAGLGYWATYTRPEGQPRHALPLLPGRPVHVPAGR